MNQGALVLDIRKPEEFAAGHVNGAKQLPSDQILTAGDNFKRFKEKPVVVYCRIGLAGRGRGTPAQPARFHQGVLAARRLCRLARGKPAGHQGGLMSQPAVVMYTTDWCPYCERARRLLASKNVSIEEIDVESAAEKRAEMRNPQRPALRAADFHRRPPRGRQRRSAGPRSGRRARWLVRPLNSFNTGQIQFWPDFI